jgi:ABC-type enterochelin transport system substrate-binding protein
MRSPTFVRFLIVSCAALAIVLVGRAVVHAQAGTSVGLIAAVDLATNTLTLETRTGTKTVRVAPSATIYADHGAVLSIRDLAVGDAVSYPAASDTVATLRVARQFWAIPREW